MKFETKTLGQLSIDGKGHYGIAAPAVRYSQSLPTYLRITDIKDDGTINLDGVMSVDDPKSKYFLLRPNDIVFARTGASIGRNYFCEDLKCNLVYAGFLIKFSIDKRKINPKYIKYYCLSQTYKNWINSFSTGSTRGNINAKTYANMPILVPCRKHQDITVKILSALDDKIELNNRINKNLEAQAQAIFDNMFPYICGGNKTVGDYIIPKRGKNLLSKNTNGGNVPVVAGGLEPSVYHDTANTIAPVITISASGANAGYVNLWHIPVWSSDSSYIDSGMTNDVYFWYIFLKKKQSEIFDSQTGSAQPHIYPQHISVLKIEELNQQEVSDYTNKVTNLFKLIGNNQIENSILKQERDTLLPKLMSGELDVENLNV